MPDDPTTGSDTEYRDISGVLRFLPRRDWGGTIHGWFVLGAPIYPYPTYDNPGFEGCGIFFSNSYEI